jgi:hypothetical protein
VLEDKGRSRSNCMYELYEMHVSVKGMENESVAFVWLLNAGDFGHTGAAETIGTYCMKRDEGLARFWLSKAASASAKRTLATLGKEKQPTMDEHLARIAAALAKIPIAK